MKFTESEITRYLVYVEWYSNENNPFSIERWGCDDFILDGGVFHIDNGFYLHESDARSGRTVENQLPGEWILPSIGMIAKEE